MDEPFEPLPDTRLVAWAKRHAAPIRVVSFITGAIAAGYLWAVLLGDGVRGLQSTAQLDNSSTYPDANVAWIAALGLLSASWVAAVKTVPYASASSRLAVRWMVATFVAGGAFFVVSRLFA